MIEPNDWYVEKNETDFTIKYYSKEQYVGKGLTFLTGTKESEEKWDTLKKSGYSDLSLIYGG